VRLLGFFFLPAGGFLVLASVFLLGRKAQLPVFVLAGIAVELSGLVMVARSFLKSRDRS